MIDYDILIKSFNDNLFFKNKKWRVSPYPLSLSSDIIDQINKTGNACFDFLNSINKLYHSSKNNKSILRNKNLVLPWISKYFDCGKSNSILKHSNLNLYKNSLPIIIRPDLIITNDGLAMTELEVIPGGIGFTSFLHRLYESQNSNLIGSSSKMLDGFYNSLINLVRNKESPIITILISDESETYKPEFIWLANELRSSGKKVYCVDPTEIYYEDSKLKVLINNEVIEIDIIYRFFELFDLENIPTAPVIMQAIEDGHVVASPPLNPIFEEKLCMALFHHYQLEDFWKESLPKESLQILKRLIPASWIIDSEPFGPNAMLNGPFINGIPLSSWSELAEATQKNRNFIIKRSGYNQDAWGARSVTIGTDCSQETWAKSIVLATNDSKSSPFIIQEFKKPKKIYHPIYSEKGDSIEEPGRVRLCPFYMRTEDKVELKGILGTICPADKKIIHGMSVATFIPCTEKS